jgi:hypothetical protein
MKQLTGSAVANMQSHPNPASPLEYCSCKLYNLKYEAYLEHKGGVDDDAVSKH